MGWAAVYEYRNANMLQAHQDISELEENYNEVILIVTKALDVISN